METNLTDAVSGISAQSHGHMTWIDVAAPGEAEFAWLEQNYHLHPVHLDESLQRVQHNQVEREDHYLFFVLHIPHYVASTDRIVVKQVGIFLGKTFLVTIHDGKIPVVSELFEATRQQPEQQERYFKRGSAYLLYVLISQMLSDMFDIAEATANELDSIEDLVFGNNASDAYRIGRLRQKIVKLGRLTGPKRIVLDDLAQQIGDFADQSMTKYYSNNTKTVNKLWEVIEEAKETVEIYKDSDFITSTEQTNRTLAILTLVFTLTIPSTAVGALYGMNVPLPGGLVTGAWSFWGKYTTLWVILLVSGGAALGMYAYFKRKRLF